MIGHTIVVVDDQQEILGLLKGVLEDEGYHVMTADNPTEIEPAIVRHEPALFFIDIMLPRMSGIALTEHLRTTGYGTIPMVAMSTSSIMIKYAADSGWFTSTLEKPFDLNRFLGHVQQHLDG